MLTIQDFTHTTTVLPKVTNELLAKSGGKLLILVVLDLLAQIIPSSLPYIYFVFITASPLECRLTELRCRCIARP